MILLPPDLKDFLRLLNSSEAEYLLVGGYAVGYYGYPRATGDMDIWIARSSGNAANVMAALQAFGFSSSGVLPALFLMPDKVFRMGNPPLRIELLTDITGVEFAACWESRVVSLIEDITVNIISLDDLKRNKLASGRLKDKNDLKHLP